MPSPIQLFPSLSLLLLLWLPLAAVVEATILRHPTPADDPWLFVQPAGATQSMPVRIMAPDEPWADVVRDVQARVSRAHPTAPVKVGIYGHGAFVAPADVVSHSGPFVAALGLSAALDVMVFPQWRFPQALPFEDLPAQLAQTLWQTPPQHLRAALREVLQRPLRQFAHDHRAATTQAALRLAQGLQAFHRAQMTPALATYSYSALVLVRLGELLAQDVTAEQAPTEGLPETLRQDLAIRDLVIFGYPLPQGTVTPALRQRVQGRVVNVLPATCWQQVAGNFPVSGAVDNLAVAWAPAHANWPRLTPQSEAVAVLGALLGGRRQAARLATQQSRPSAGLRPWVESWQESLCALLPGVPPSW